VDVTHLDTHMDVLHANSVLFDKRISYRELRDLQRTA
jgi:hypothetical protein